MRKLILCGALLCLTVNLFAQQATPATAMTREQYIRKSSSQTAGGILMAVAGTGLLVGAFSYDMNHLFDATASNTTALYVAGLGCAGGSVALFLAAGRNRRAAREATVSPSVRLDRALVPDATGIKTQRYPSIALSVRL